MSKPIMAKRSIQRIFSTSSLHDLCLCKLIEELDHYSPEMLSLLPHVQRKELLLLCPVVSICHLEQTCVFDGIDSDTFWDDLLEQHYMRLGLYRNYEFHSCEALRVSHSSSREKYFSFLTAMIFSGDRFSGVYGLYLNTERDFYEGCSPPPKERSCPNDIVNYLVAYRKSNVIIKKPASNRKEFYYPLPSRDVFGRQHGKLYKYATKGQHVHSRYSHYISKENHYRLSDDDAVSLMMNECNYYPKKLFLHEYEHMHWKWSHDDLMRLLTQFFGKLESLSLVFRRGKDIDDYVGMADQSNEALELVMNCCFSSPVLCSLVMVDPSRRDTASQTLSSTLATKPCPSLRILDIHCYTDIYRGEARCLEALAKIIASHSNLTEIRLRLNTSVVVAASSFSSLYTSLIGFVQREEFSKLTLHGQVSSQLRPLLDAFFKTPCSRPQEIHLYSVESAHNEATSIHLPEGDSKVPCGALEYKSLSVYEHSKFTVDFCDWLFSHEPLVLKAFNFNASVMELGEYGRLVPSETAFPVHILSNNALFQTQELSLPIFDDFPNQPLQNLLHRQQLTHLTLRPTKPPVKNQFYLRVEEVPKPCNIDAITEILLCQKEQLIELTISRGFFEYISIEPSTNMERFGDTLFSLRNFELFSLHIAIMWKKEDTRHIDRLYNSWLKHGCKRMKSFQMGKFEYQFSLTDELATKLDKMGLVITQS